MLVSYLPVDRRHALAHGAPLPDRASGAVLFADLAGFTALTAALVQALGPQRGAEELTAALDRVYDTLIEAVDQYGGSVVVFGGDALTAWFDGDTGETATACALAMQRAMRAFEGMPVPGSPLIALGLKTTVAAGPIRRFLVGDPSIQRIEVLAGATMVRLAQAASLTKQGEVVVDEATSAHLADALQIQTHRPGPPDAPACAVISGLRAPIQPTPWPPLPPDALPAEQLRPWLLPPVYARLQAGLGDFLADLRTTVAMFVRFGDLDYDTDDAAGDKLDAFVRWVQAVLARYDGWLLTVTIGDKGSTLYITFGAPIAHSDDPRRAAAAALDLGRLPPDLAYAGPIHIGMSAGQGRAGSYGGSTRTYSVISDATNLAARLMQAAAPGQVLLSANLAPTVSRHYTVNPLADMYVKGKSEPIPIITITGLKPASDIRLSEPQYTTPLVGRSAELALIETQLALARQGHGQIIGVTGEAGMGKSRLVAEIIRRALAAGCVGYGGEAQATATQTPYLAWQPIWRAFFNLDPQATLAEQTTALERELVRLDPTLLPRLPLLAEALGLPLPDNELTRQMDGRLRKEAREGLLIDCLRARAATTPLLLVLEDVHWLDSLSVDLASAIGRAIPDWPVLVVLAYRPLETWRGASFPVLALPHVTTVQLTELLPQEATQLILHKLRATYGPDLTPPVSVMDAIAGRAEGNPLYIEELLNYLHDRGIVPDTPEALERLALPGSLASLLLSRIDQLTVEQQTTLKVASIIGRVFRVGWLWGVYPALGPPARVREDLASLARLDLTPLDTPDPDLHYLFKHALTHEVAYDSLPFSQRAQLHGHLAGWLETQPEVASDLDLLAYHYGRSAHTAKQREYFHKAGDAAAARYANAPAAQYYERLLPLLAPPEQGQALITLGRILEKLNEWEAAETRYQQALALADEIAALPLRAQAQFGLGVVERSRARYDAALQWLEQARQGFVQLGDRQGLRFVLNELAIVYLWRYQVEQGETLLAECVALAEADNDVRQLASAYFVRGNLASVKSDYAAARQYYQQSLALRRQLDDKPGVAAAITNLGMLAIGQGQYDEARTLLQASIAQYQELGARQDYGLARSALALVRIAQHQAGEAGAIFIETLALFRDLGSLQHVAGSLIGLARASQAADPTADASRYALRLCGAAANLFETLGSQPLPIQGALSDQVRAESALYLSAAEVQAAWDAGHAMTWPDAISYALDDRP
ncbi:MAG: tetratricopeptide repeat protein [Anaerolineae bacterium]|nr:tetratricopeptide repeat protein [Anaerolineae bacterium]